MPHCAESLRRFVPPVPERLLRASDFFTLYPLDGGGSLITQQLLGTLDDREIADRMLRRGALRAWGRMPKLDFARLERWRSVEMSCWINRMYFVASLARAYWLTGDTRIARAAADVALHFIRSYPPPVGVKAIADHVKYVYRIRDEEYNRRTYEENLRDETDVRYIWFDFQPASRVIHLLYACRFLEGADCIRPEEFREIHASIRQHAEVIRIGDRFRPQEKGDNHQSLRGLALMMAGAFFRGTGAWKSYLDAGARVMRFHIEQDFLEDGALAENSPSYHCFETWHVRDALALARRCDVSLGAGASARLRRAAAFIRALCQPDGFSPVVNDGYAVHLEPFIATLPAGAPGARGETAFFRDAGFGVFRDARRYLLFDASPFTGQFSHYHAGKNALTLWMGRKPFLVDSGCPSYEDKLFATWYKRAEAHSSLLVDGAGDGTIIGTYNWKDFASPVCGGWRRSGDTPAIASHLTSSAEAWQGIAWERAVRVGREVVLDDRVQGAKGRRLEVVLNLHPDVSVSRQGAALLLANGGQRVRVTFETDAGAPVKAVVATGRCFIAGRHRRNRRVLLQTRGEGATRIETRLAQV